MEVTAVGQGKVLIVNGQASLFLFKEDGRLLAGYQSETGCYILFNNGLIKRVDPPFAIPALSKIKVSIGGGGYILIEVTSAIHETER